MTDGDREKHLDARQPGGGPLDVFTLGFGPNGVESFFPDSGGGSFRDVSPMFAPVSLEGGSPRFVLVFVYGGGDFFITAVEEEGSELNFSESKDGVASEGREVVLPEGFEDCPPKTLQRVWLRRCDAERTCPCD